MMQWALGSRQLEMQHSQQNGEEQGPPAGEGKYQPYTPEHKPASYSLREHSRANQHVPLRPTEITVQRAQLRQQAEIFWGGWWSLLLVSADKFSPSYSLHEPEYLTQAVALTSLPLKQTLH